MDKTDGHMYIAFSKLMKKYRTRKNLSITELHALLVKKCQYVADYDTIRRYDRGERMPDDTFVVLMKHCLELNEYEFESLVDSIIIDHNTAKHDAYEEVTRRLIMGKSPCAPVPDVL